MKPVYFQECVSPNQKIKLTARKRGGADAAISGGAAAYLGR